MRDHKTNVRVGRDKKFFGDQFEAWHVGQLNAAVVGGILAHWFHPEPKFIFVHSAWQPAERSVSDFVGILEGSRSFAAETKSVKGDYFLRSLVAKKQEEHLDACARAGGLALLVGEFRLDSVRMRFACPWLEVPWEVKRSAESISPILMAPWDVNKFPDCYLKRWHSGGKRSGTWSALRKRVYATE